MNGRQAKRLRKEIYGTDYSPRHREYKRAGDSRVHFGMIVADDRRRAYRKAKRALRRRGGR